MFYASFNRLIQLFMGGLYYTVLYNKYIKNKYSNFIVKNTVFNVIILQLYLNNILKTLIGVNSKFVACFILKWKLI